MRSINAFNGKSLKIQTHHPSQLPYSMCESGIHAYHVQSLSGIHHLLGSDYLITKLQVMIYDGEIDCHRSIGKAMRNYRASKKIESRRAVPLTNFCS